MYAKYIVYRPVEMNDHSILKSNDIDIIITIVIFIIYPSIYYTYIFTYKIFASTWLRNKVFVPDTIPLNSLELIK